MRIALWIVLAGLLTYVTGAALNNAARSDDRETLIGNMLLSWSVGWYMVSSWRRAYGAARTRLDVSRVSLGAAKNRPTPDHD
ncbi:hypothetical protein OHS59_39495 [Streptomyces sp. NBC_00414]|uniref:hypothetical protein n=1 Tax=Streptomyces sp. NBC_00414 TaxID=2975739 RepID=UPI002E1AF03B